MKNLTINAIGIDNHDAAKVHMQFINEMTQGLKRDLNEKND